MVVAPSIIFVFFWQQHRFVQEIATFVVFSLIGEFVLFFSPPSPGSLNTLRQQLQVSHQMSGGGMGAMSPTQHSLTGQSSPSVYFGLSRRGSLSSLTGLFVCCIINLKNRFSI